MRKIVFCGDSYAVSSLTDYEWLTKENLIDKKNINEFDFLLNLKNYDKNINSIFKISQIIKKENSWANRLANLLNIEHVNLGMPGSAWQSVYNQILYALHKWHETEELLFLIATPVNERIISSLKKEYTFDFFNFYDFEKDSIGDLLLNNSSYFRENKIKHTIDFIFDEQEISLLKELFDKKIFKTVNFQTIVSIINTLKIYGVKFFFLPTWYENFKAQIEELNINKNLLNSFIISKIDEEQLFFMSPTHLKDFKDVGFSSHPSFYSQELIAKYYYDFLRDKI